MCTSSGYIDTHWQLHSSTRAPRLRGSCDSFAFVTNILRLIHRTFLTHNRCGAQPCVESAFLSEAVTGISGCRSPIASGSLRTRRLGFRCLQTQRTYWSGGDTESTPRTLRGIRAKPIEMYLPSRRDGCRRKVRSSQSRCLPG